MWSHQPFIISNELLWFTINFTGMLSTFHISNRHLWFRINFHDPRSTFLNICQLPCNPINFAWFRWTSVDPYGLLWNPLNIPGTLWNCLVGAAFCWSMHVFAGPCSILLGPNHQLLLILMSLRGFALTFQRSHKLFSDPTNFCDSSSTFVESHQLLWNSINFCGIP